jgi:hypothetical protein
MCDICFKFRAREAQFHEAAQMVCLSGPVGHCFAVICRVTIIVSVKNRQNKGKRCRGGLYSLL